MKLVKVEGPRGLTDPVIVPVERVLEDVIDRSYEDEILACAGEALVFSVPEEQEHG